MPRFLLQIVDADAPYAVARLPAGGALEVDLIDICTQAILARGVGYFASSAHVEQDIRDGMREALLALKDLTRFMV